MAGIGEYNNLMKQEDSFSSLPTSKSQNYTENQRRKNNIIKTDNFNLSSVDNNSLNEIYENNSLFQTFQEEFIARKVLTKSIGSGSLIVGKILSHPFVIIRRQCQVHYSSVRYHLLPFTLLPTIFYLHQRQGFAPLWKGVGACFLINGSSLAIEYFLTKKTPWPKEINNRNALKDFGRHILFKCLSISIMMPFHTASFVACVQSSMASENPKAFDVIKEGGCRFLLWNKTRPGGLLPFWILIGPSVSFGLTKYIFSMILKKISFRIMQRRLNDSLLDVDNRKHCDNYFCSLDAEIYSSLISTIISEIIFYPFETVLYRLYLQGTRSIIDNLDNGCAILTISTNYEGALDCYRAIVGSEGFCGLYKGFGALLIQFSIQIAALKAVKRLVNQISTYSKKPNKIIKNLTDDL